MTMATPDKITIMTQALSSIIQPVRILVQIKLIYENHLFFDTFKDKKGLIASIRDCSHVTRSSGSNHSAWMKWLQNRIRSEGQQLLIHSDS